MGADSGQGIFTAAEPFHPPAAFPRENFMTAANVVTTTINADFPNFPTVSANVDFLQNVQSNFPNFSNAVTRADFAQDVLMDFADIVTAAAGGDFSGDTQRAADVDVAIVAQSVQQRTASANTNASSDTNVVDSVSVQTSARAAGQGVRAVTDHATILKCLATSATATVHRRRPPSTMDRPHRT